MRWIVLIGLLPVVANATDYSDRDACLADLKRALSTKEAFSNQKEVREFQFETVPGFGDQHVEKIVEAYVSIENAWAAISDELLVMCGKYPEG